MHSLAKKLLVSTLLISALLVGCEYTQEDAPLEGQVQLYFATDQSKIGGPAVASVDYLLQDPDNAITELVSILLDGPSEDITSLSNPFPSGVTLQGWHIEDGGMLTLQLSGEYASLTGVDLTLADYCLTLTLCQLDTVESLVINLGREAEIQRAIQIMRPEDVILSGAEEEPVYLSVVLWFPSQQSSGLAVETRTLELTQKDNVAQAIIEALLEGSTFDGRDPMTPEGTTLLEVTVEDGVCAVDLSQEFLVQVPTTTQGARYIYSMVNTLCGTEYVDIDVVYFYVEGQPLLSYGALDMRDGILPQYELEGS